MRSFRNRTASDIPISALGLGASRFTGVMDNTSEYFVGVDFGATKIRAGVFDHALRCVGMAKVRTKGYRGTDAVIERIARCAQYAVDEADVDLKKVRGVGVGAPGTVDHETGSVLFAPNLGWREVNLKKELEKILSSPVFVANDCGAAMLGVYEMLRTIVEVAFDDTLAGRSKDVEIVTSKLGDQAGITGAALFAKRELK